jgi:hypothetical protein
MQKIFQKQLVMTSSTDAHAIKIPALIIRFYPPLIHPIPEIPPVHFSYRNCFSYRKQSIPRNGWMPCIKSSGP